MYASQTTTAATKVKTTTTTLATTLVIKFCLLFPHEKGERKKTENNIVDVRIQSIQLAERMINNGHPIPLPDRVLEHEH